MAGETAALVVALSAQITQFERALDKAKDVADRRVRQIDESFAKANKSISDRFRELGNSLSNQIGGLGNIVTGLGPAGIVAAAGLGGVVLALDAMRQGAHQLAQQAGELRDFAHNIGLSTAQLQALNDAGAKFALTEEKIGSALQRFSAQMEDFRRGEGELFQLVQRIDPVLARQIALARDTAREIDLLGQVYEKAGSRATALSRAAFGRTGFGVGNLVQEIRRSGGIEQLTAEFVRSGDALDENLIKKITVLKREIDDMAADARRNFQSIYSEQFLSRQKVSTELWLEFSRAAKSFAISPDFDKLVQFISAGANTGEFSAFITALSTTPIGQIATAVENARRIIRGATGETAAAPTPSPVAGPTVQSLMPDPGSGLRAASLEEEVRLLERAVQLAKERVRTETDIDAIKREATIIESAQTQIAEKRRAINELEANQAQKRVGFLGDAATQTEKLDAETKKLVVTGQQQGLSEETIKRAIEARTLAQTLANAATRTALGIATEEEIIQGRLALLNAQRARGLQLTAEEAQRAEAIIRKESKQTFEQMQVRASQFPQLTRMAQDAQNLNRGLDQFAASAFSSFENNFADFVTGTKSASQAFKDMTNSVIRDLARLVIRQTLTAPLAGLFSSFLGGGVPGVGATGPTLIPKMASGGVIPAGGIAYVGEHGPNPRLIRAGSEPVTVTPGSIRGGGSAPVFNMQIENHAGADVTTQRQTNRTRGLDLRVMIRRAVQEDTAAGHFDGANRRYGLNPVGIRR